MNRSELFNKIREVFADVPYPGDDSIGCVDGRNDAEYISSLLCGRDWRSLKPRELCAYGLGFLTPEAFQYYLPAYLIAANKASSGDVIDSVIRSLTPPHLMTDPELAYVSAKIFAEDFSLFTPAQKRVLGDFFDYVIQDSIKWNQKYLGRQLIEFPHRIAQDQLLRDIRDYWRKF